MYGRNVQRTIEELIYLLTYLLTYLHCTSLHVVFKKLTKVPAAGGVGPILSAMLPPKKWTKPSTKKRQMHLHNNVCNSAL